MIGPQTPIKWRLVTRLLGLHPLLLVVALIQAKMPENLLKRGQLIVQLDLESIVPQGRHQCCACTSQIVRLGNISASSFS